MLLKSILILLIVHSVLAEVQECKKDEICIRVCCSNCSDLDISDAPGIENLKKDYSVIIGKPDCDMYELDLEDEFDEWKILADGSLLTEHSEKPRLSDEYCLVNEDDYDQGFNGSWRARICFELNYDTGDFKLNLYPILFSISLPFSIATFLVYAIVDDLRNLPGKCLMFYVLSLTFLHIGLAIIQFEVPQLGLFCTTLGYFVHFLAPLNTMWLCLMSFDSWQAFRNFGRQHNSNKMLAFYCILAFGVPSIILGAMLFFEHVASIEELKPDVGEFGCLIMNETANYIFLLGPLTIITTMSVIFLILAATHVFRRNENDDCAGYTRLSAEKDRFMMYLKLFAFLAFFWGFEIISHFWQLPIFIITDILNCFQGLIIFVIFVLEKRTRQIIAARYRAWRGNR